MFAKMRKIKGISYRG